MSTRNSRKQRSNDTQMNERLEDDDRTALAGISNSPPHRKAYSYSQQLRTNTGTHHKRQHQLRKHSLDENRILSHNPKNSVYVCSTPNSSSDDEFYPYSTVTAASSGVAVGSVSDHHVDYLHLSQRIGGMAVADGGGDDDECENFSQQPMPEFMGSGGGVGIFKVPNRVPSVSRVPSSSSPSPRYTRARTKSSSTKCSRIDATPF